MGPFLFGGGALSPLWCIINRYNIYTCTHTHSHICVGVCVLQKKYDKIRTWNVCPLYWEAVAWECTQTHSQNGLQGYGREWNSISLGAARMEYVFYLSLRCSQRLLLLHHKHLRIFRWIKKMLLRNYFIYVF